MATPKKIIVWLIDDNKEFCIILSEVLNRTKSISCEQMFDAVMPALAHLKHSKHKPAVILLDIKMPTMNGIDAIKPILKLSPETCILMLSSYNDSDEIRLSLQRGACGYLLKTATTEEITSAIKKVLEGGKPLDPMVSNALIDMVVKKKPTKTMKCLSDREKEIVDLLALGFDKKKISEKLHVSPFTIDAHRRNIFKKLRVHSIQELLAVTLNKNNRL